MDITTLLKFHKVWFITDFKILINLKIIFRLLFPCSKKMGNGKGKGKLRKGGGGGHILS